MLNLSIIDFKLPSTFKDSLSDMLAAIFAVVSTLACFFFELLYATAHGIFAETFSLWKSLLSWMRTGHWRPTFSFLEKALEEAKRAGVVGLRFSFKMPGSVFLQFPHTYC